MPWKQNRKKLEELENRVAALEQRMQAMEKEKPEKIGSLAIPADIMAEWLQGKG